MPTIPWAAILTHAPAIVSAAERLLARTGPTKSIDKAQGIEARLERLEKGSAESARLIQDIAQQLQAIAVAQEAAAQRTRVAVIVGAVAAGLAVVAGVLAVVW
jgi:hypothetical protein